MRYRPGVCLVACLVAVGVWFAPQFAHAQDTHYWNNQYGPRAMLLGGSVIGSVQDMSGTFYNPGALGYIEEPELLLSANVYQATTLRIEDGAGEGIDLETSGFNPLPNMVAGAIRGTWLGKNKIAYSVLTRNRFDAEIRGASVTRADVLDQYPGDEEFVGGLLKEGDAKELWVGLTYARGGVGNKVGFGVTTYLSIRNQGIDSEIFAQALSDSGDIALVYDIKNYSYDAYSLLWKAGLGFDLTPFSAGITLTTPNLQMFGSGRTAFNETRIGLADIEDGFASNIQEDVTANYKSPLSIGVGAAWHAQKAKVHLSAEWFDGIDTYQVLELENFESQATGEIIEPALRQTLNSVVNVGAGVEYRYTEKSTAYLSFNTDNSAFNPESNVSVTGFDIKHFAAGVKAGFKRTELMLGLGYAWGSEKIRQDINLNPDDDDAVIETGNEVNVVYRRLTFMLGFSVKI
jgi:hypothetical protein